MENKQKGDLAEEALNSLAYDTYLKYWCFPNPKDLLGNKKEICDLLIVFRDVVLIVSIKNYEFKNNYARYFKSTLKKGIDQIHGAERKLFNENRIISFDHPNRGPFRFDPKNYKTVCRIFVNHNCEPKFYPGGAKTKAGKYVHIFNWDAFMKTVKELDTIPDFIKYIEEREQIFSNRELIFTLGEEKDWNIEHTQAYLEFSRRPNSVDFDFMVSGTELDILACYLGNNRKFPKEFNNDVDSTFLLLDGNWDEFVNNLRVTKKRLSDRKSYFVDELVKREILPSDNPVQATIAIELLSCSRFERRVIGKAFYAFLDDHYTTHINVVPRRYIKIRDLTICFLQHDDSWERDEIVLFMDIATRGYCLYEGYKSKSILTIGINTSLDHFKFMFINDIKAFSPAEEKEVWESFEYLEWFEEMIPVPIKEQEYPDL